MTGIPRSMERGSAAISIVIPTFRRVERLKILLVRLAAVEGASQFDVLVIDQTRGADLSSLEHLSTCFARLLLVKLDAPNVARARNTGARQALASILLFMDDDMELEASFVSRLLALMHAASDIAFGAVWTEGDEASHDRVPETAAGLAEGRDFLPTGVLAVRRQHFFTVGGFDERLFRYFEDAEFSHRLKLAGLSLVRHRDLRAIHHDQRENGTWHSAGPVEAASTLMRQKAYFLRKTGRGWPRVCQGLLQQIKREVSHPFYLQGSNIVTRAAMTVLSIPAALSYAGQSPALCGEPLVSAHGTG